MYHPCVYVHIIYAYTWMLLHILICTTHISLHFIPMNYTHISLMKRYCRYHETLMVLPQKPYLLIHTQSFVFCNSFWLTGLQSCEILESERVWVLFTRIQYVEIKNNTMLTSDSKPLRISPFCGSIALDWSCLSCVFVFMYELLQYTW